MVVRLDGFRAALVAFPDMQGAGAMPAASLSVDVGGGINPPAGLPDPLPTPLAAAMAAARAEAAMPVFEAVSPLGAPRHGGGHHAWDVDSPVAAAVAPVLGLPPQAAPNPAAPNDARVD